MGTAEISLIAVALAMDAFAVSLAAGTMPEICGPRPAFRLAFHFGLFQFLMPVIGWAVGSQVAGLIAAFDHWVAFGLLAIVGTRMIRSGVKGAETRRADPSRGLALIALSVATSIDALAVGLSLAMLRVDIWYASFIIGLVAAGLSLVGIFLGSRLGAAFGSRMEIAGGIVLFLIGLRILYTHLLV